MSLKYITTLITCLIVTVNSNSFGTLHHCNFIIKPTQIILCNQIFCHIIISCSLHIFFINSFFNRCLEQRGKPTCVYDSRSRKCRCPQCSDITNKFKCITRRPCPESKNFKSFCYWNTTLKCDCCTPPRFCPKPKIVFDRSSCSCVCPKIRCPRGRVFNSKTCKCDCPRGTKEVNGKCVGE